MMDRPSNPAAATAPPDVHAPAHRSGTLWAGVIGGLAAGLLFALLWLGPSQDRFAFLYADFTIAACLQDNGITNATPRAAEGEVIACYNRLVRQGQLNEFQVRRINFMTQHVADSVTLWMVVTLTVCGVALAAWQIFTSSKLITENPEALTSELSIESGKIFVRSSVTGLLILMVSFAFFYVYVVWVYQIRTWSDDTQIEAILDGDQTEDDIFVPLDVMDLPDVTADTPLVITVE